MWTDADIDVFEVKVIPYNVVRYNQIQVKLKIHGGTIDVSPVLEYSHVALHLFRRHGYNIRADFDINIEGPNKKFLVNGNYVYEPNTSTGMAIVFDEDDWESEWGNNNGGFQGAKIRGFISRFHTAVKFNIDSESYLTNHSYNLAIQNCKYAYNLGTIGNGGGEIQGDIQCGTYFTTPQNGEPIILGDVFDCYFNCFVYDVGYSSMNTNQYTFILPYSDYKHTRLRIGERIRLDTIGGDISKIDTWKSSLVSYPSIISRYDVEDWNYLKLIDNNLFNYPFETDVDGIVLGQNVVAGTYDSFWRNGIKASPSVEKVDFRWNILADENSTLTVFSKGFYTECGVIVRFYLQQRAKVNALYFKKATVYAYNTENVDKSGEYNSTAVNPTQVDVIDWGVYYTTGTRTTRLDYKQTLGIKAIRIVFSEPQLTKTSGKHAGEPVDLWIDPTATSPTAIPCYIRGEAATDQGTFNHLFTRSSITIPEGKSFNSYGNTYIRGRSWFYDTAYMQSCQIAEGKTLEINGNAKYGNTYFRYYADAKRWETGGYGNHKNSNGIFVDGINHPDIGNTATRTTGVPNTSSAEDKAKYAGYMYFDTDLHKWVVWDGAQWTDMCGNALTT